MTKTSATREFRNANKEIFTLEEHNLPVGEGWEKKNISVYQIGRSGMLTDKIPRVIPIDEDVIKNGIKPLTVEIFMRDWTRNAEKTFFMNSTFQTVEGWSDCTPDRVTKVRPISAPGIMQDFRSSLDYTYDILEFKDLQRYRQLIDPIDIFRYIHRYWYNNGKNLRVPITSNDYIYVLRDAIQKNDFNVVKFMFEDMDTQVEWTTEYTVSSGDIITMAKNKSVKMFEYILDNYNICRNVPSESALCAVIQSGNVFMLVHLIANVKHTDLLKGLVTGKRVEYAIGSGSVSMLEYFENSGDTIRMMIDPPQNTEVFSDAYPVGSAFAASKGHTEMLEYITTNKKFTNSTPRFGEILLLAAENNQVKVLEWLRVDNERWSSLEGYFDEAVKLAFYHFHFDILVFMYNNVEKYATEGVCEHTYGAHLILREYGEDAESIEVRPSNPYEEDPKQYLRDVVSKMDAYFEWLKVYSNKNSFHEWKNTNTLKEHHKVCGEYKRVYNTYKEEPKTVFYERFTNEQKKKAKEFRPTESRVGAYSYWPTFSRGFLQKEYSVF